MTNKSDKDVTIIIPNIIEETTVKMMYEVTRQMYELQTHLRSIETQIGYIYTQLDQKVNKH
jgi:type II secretory pathway predicted ATPase ExeA